jgi:hypothetical protein
MFANLIIFEVKFRLLEGRRGPTEGRGPGATDPTPSCNTSPATNRKWDYRKSSLIERTVILRKRKIIRISGKKFRRPISFKCFILCNEAKLVIIQFLGPFMCIISTSIDSN